MVDVLVSVERGSFRDCLQLDKMLLVDRRGAMTDQHCEYARKLLNEDDDEDDDDDSGDNSDDGDDDDDGKS